MERVVRDEDRLYIYLSAMYALVVPRETITDGDFDEFALACENRFSAQKA